MLKTSPLAVSFPDIPSVDGVILRIAKAHYKEWDRCDLTYIELDEATTVAGVFTRNICCSAEVEIGREQLAHGKARAMIVNAGNSNAFTGARGRETVDMMIGKVAKHLDCAHPEVFVSSTGVIGVPLPKDLADAGLDAAFKAEPCGWRDAAEAICTTDTFPKGATATAIVDGCTITLSAIAKGSGMIAPDMATMLGYIFTDAAIAPDFLQTLLSSATDKSFNSISVDSDTSTSDTVLLFASGKAGNAQLNSFDDAGADAFAAALDQVCSSLAQQIVRDGEGASKFITIDVTGAQDNASAHAIGLSIANSPLVKTAIAGEDANWGRIVMAVGKAGQPADRDRLAIRFGPHWVARHGAAIDGYDETLVASHLANSEIDIGVDIGLGDGRATLWTCDLTHDYITINADYRS